jgi:hypothetical protein
MSVTYLLPLLVAAMLGYMFWSVTFRLRRDRLLATRRSDRSQTILTPRQRARNNLTRAFEPPAQKPDWETGLLARLHD